MIRPFCNDDMDAVIRLWLEASVQAHFFIAPEYWEAEAADMRVLDVCGFGACAYGMCAES